MIYLLNAECSTTITNTGMKTVDLAWDILLKKNNLNLDYNRYSIKLKKQKIEISKKHSLNYNSYIDFSNKPNTKNDIIIFWGDFIHSYNYFKKDIKRMTLKPKFIKEDTLKSSIRVARWYIFNKNETLSTILKRSKFMQFTEKDFYQKALDFYLPQNLQNSSKHSISFGTTMLGDNEINLINSEYKSYIVNFLENINRIWVREFVSAQHVANLSNDYVQNFLGIDCALLIDKKGYNLVLDEISIELPKNDYMVCHFGRTKASINDLLNLSIKLSEELGLHIVWVPWLSELNKNNFQDLDNSLLKNITAYSNLSYSNIIHLVSNAKYSITDTYHMNLISWRLEVPVSCIGYGSQKPKTTIDDKKKEIFHLIYNMLPQYFYTENIQSKEKIIDYVSNVKKLFEEKSIYVNIINKIKNHAESIEKQLIEEIKYGLEK